MKHRFMFRRCIASLGVSALAVSLTAVATAGAATAASGTLTFTFYDTTGALLTSSQVHTIEDGQSQGYDADAFLDPATLAMVGNPNPMGAGLSATLPSSPASVDFAMNWVADPNGSSGYSLVILDNGGAGFSSGGTVNFTYQAANDAKVRLDAALAARTSPVYVHSAAFDSAYSAATTELAAANAPGASESTKGMNGALALEQLTIANNDMLREYGTAYAAANTSVADRWIGFTLDESQAAGKYVANLQTAHDITASSPAVETGWVRFVLDPTITMNANQVLSTYGPEITAAHSQGLKVMVEPVDSSYCDASSPTAPFNCTAANYHTVFENVTTELTGTAAPDAFEVGNEVNGDWVVSTAQNPASARVADAAAVVTANAPGKLRVLTLFYQINTAQSTSTSLFNWAEANLSTSTRTDLDDVLLSTYVEQAPLGLAFDEVMHQMQAEFPAQKIGIGELGYWIKGQRFWWEFTNPGSGHKPTVAQLMPIADQYYRAALGYSDSVGAGFWWNYPSEIATSTDFQCIFESIRTDLGASGSCGGGGGSGNTHSGTWAGVGMLPASPAYKDLYQTVSVASQTTDVASIWIKGSGAVQVNVWANAAWTTNLAKKKCTASGTWTECTLPSFATGNRSAVYFDIEDAYSGAGTVYVDDTFLGQQGGTNLIGNPGFESGNTVWDTNSTSIWSVTQP